MRPGYELLRDFDREVFRLRDEIAVKDQRLKELMEKNRKIQLKKGELLDTIAQAHTHSAIEQNTEPLNTAIENKLKDRENALDALEASIAKTKQELIALEQEREGLAKDLSKQTKEVLQLEKILHEKLENHKEFKEKYLLAVDAYEQSKVVKLQAKKASDRWEKYAKPYRQDPLFMYLWERKYATPQYRSRGLIKLIDGWLARYTQYEKNRKNYFLQSKSVERLEKHAQKKDEYYQKIKNELLEIKYGVIREIGLEAQRQKEVSLRDKLDSVDLQMIHTEKKLQELGKQRNAFLENQDPYSQEIERLWRKALEKVGIKRLEEISEQTLTDKDNTAVEALKALLSEEEALTQEMQKLKSEYDKKLKDLRQIEAMRNRFKSFRYDDRRSTFEGSIDIASVVRGVVNGLYQVADAWVEISARQRSNADRSWIDFGDRVWAPEPFDEGFRTGGGF